jgi:hypothetical protein
MSKGGPLIVPLQLSRKTCQKLWSLSTSAPSDFGSTKCTGGWKLTDQDMALWWNSSRFRISALQSTNHTSASQRLLHRLSIDAKQYLKRHTKSSLMEIFYFFNFDHN